MAPEPKGPHRPTELTLPRPMSLDVHFPLRNDPLLIPLKALAVCRIAMDIVGDISDIQAALNACVKAVREQVAMAVRNGQFGKAKRMAYRMVDIIPTWKEGYLLAAGVHCLEGKSGDALAVCREGIKQCGLTPSLERKLAQSWMTGEKRIDFLKYLPVDVVDIIIQGLATSDLVTCLNVSQVWRSKLGECPGAWRDISEFPIGESSVQQRHLLFSHIRHFRLTHRRYHAESIQASLRALTVNNVTCLHTLELNPNGDFPKVDAQDILIAIQENRHTLKSVTIPTSHGNQLARQALFKLVLTGCPRLDRLVCGFYGSRDISWWLDRYEGWSVPDGATSHIVDLTLLDTARLQTYALNRVLAVCPELQKLHLCGASSSVIPNILNMCPKLQILRFNLSLNAIYPAQLLEDNNNGKGLRVLDVGYNSVFRDDESFPRAIASIFDSHHETLREFTLRGKRHNYKVNRTWNGLRYAHSQSLRRLCLSLQSFDGKAIAAMISQFPCLDDVDIELNVLSDDDICASVAQLRKLRSLTLRHCSRDSPKQQQQLQEEEEEEEDGGVDSTNARTKSLGSLFSNLRSQTTLDALGLYFLPSGTDACLRYLHGIRLETLVMYGLNFSRPNKAMREFLSSSLSVRHLELGGMPCITDPLCNQIGNIQDLQEISIHNLGNVNDAGFRYLTAADSLQWIRVQNCSRISQAAVDRGSRIIPVLSTAPSSSM